MNESNLRVRPLVSTDFEQVRPMLLDMGFVEDEGARSRMNACSGTPPLRITGRTSAPGTATARLSFTTCTPRRIAVAGGWPAP